MIEVSVEPSRLVAGRRTRLAIRFANSGQRACSDVVFKLALPSAITIMGGTNRVEIPVIPPGHVHTHEMTVESKRPGEFQLTSANFSYRDEFDVPVRVTDFRARLSVEAAPPAQPVAARPVARLGVEPADGELALGEWDVLRILVRTKTGVPLSDVTVAVNGPFRTDGKLARIALLGDGATARFPFKVNAAEGGRHVPVSVRTTYSYPDGLGSVRSRTQEDSLEVVVVKTGEQSRQGPRQRAGHVFISYVREDAHHVDQLQERLEAAGVRVWRDTAELWPGEDWRVKIRQAIEDGALVFIACFSQQSLSRRRSYQNEELTLAIDQLRQRPPEYPWLIPVRFDDCKIPDRDIGAGRTLASIQWADLFGGALDKGTGRLLAAILRILGPEAVPAPGRIPSSDIKG
jgi:hypothetical protein